MITLVPLQPSVAVGRLNVQALPHSTVLFVGPFTTGGVVSTTKTVWLHEEVRLQESTASQVRVMILVLPHMPLVVTVSAMGTRMVTFVPPQNSTALGRSKVHPLLHSTVLLGAQNISGGAETTVTACVAKTWLLHASVALQTQVATYVRPQPKFVEMLTTVTVEPGVPQLSALTGGSKFQAVVQLKVLFDAIRNGAPFCVIPSGFPPIVMMEFRGVALSFLSSQ
jgi:hypothetical protein